MNEDGERYAPIVDAIIVYPDGDQLGVVRIPMMAARALVDPCAHATLFSGLLDVAVILPHMSQLEVDAAHKDPAFVQEIRDAWIRACAMLQSEDPD